MGIPKRTSGKKVAIPRPFSDEKVYRAIRQLCPSSKVYVPADSLSAMIANMLYELRYSRGWSANTISWKSGIAEDRLARFVYRHDWYPGKTW